MKRCDKIPLLQQEDEDKCGAVKDAGGTTWWTAARVEQAEQAKLHSRENVLISVLIPDGKTADTP